MSGASITARISKILIPLDDSELAMKAADYALLITKGLNAELIAIHVVRSEDALVTTNSLIENLDTITTEDSLQKVKDDAEKWFNTIKQKSNANGIRLRTGLVISPTDTEDAIVNYAERENVDLIVIGGEEKSGLKQRLHGSATSHIATQTKRSILIVK